MRIRNKGMFPSGSATISQGYYRLLERIGNALLAEKGPVQVIGYTDNQPIRTVRFPSNYQLSTARAEAARELILRPLGDPGQVGAIPGAPTPSRWRRTPPRTGATKTGASRSCCGGKAKLMRAVLRFLGSRWFLTFIGVLLVGLLIWFFGPFLGFLESWIPRAGIIAGTWC